MGGEELARASALERHEQIPRRHPARNIVVAACVLLLASGMVYYYEGILIPLRQKEFHVAGAARGNWSDLYVQWVGSREVLQHGRNPYSPEVTGEIQRGFYGSSIEHLNQKGLKNPEAFAYPVYVALLFAPFQHLSFNAVAGVFTIVFCVLTVASVPLWMSALGLRLHWWTVLLSLVIAMSSYPVVDGLHLRQMTLLVAGLMAAGMAALAAGHLVLAGVLLGVAMIKPQLVALLLLFLVIWTAGAWQARKRFVIAFAGTFGLLLLSAELLLSGWVWLWWAAVRAYAGYSNPSLLRSLLGARAATFVSGIAILLCGLLFWRARKEAPGSHPFNLALTAAVLVTVMLLPDAGGGKYNQVLLIPAVMWTCVLGWRQHDGIGLARISWMLAANVLVWQWIWALAVCFAVLVLRKSFAREANLFIAGPELLVFFFPLTLVPFVLSEAARLRLPGHRTRT